MKNNIIVIGCGFAGTVCARVLADAGYNITVIDERSHIGGNMYDYKNDDGILIHKYGPHILVLNDNLIYNFLSKFTEWIAYEHHVNVLIDDKEVPLPINYNSIISLFPKNKDIIIRKLNNMYFDKKNVTILELLNTTDSDLRKVAEFIYNKVFVDYTAKMWGLLPTEIDSSITSRIPIRLSYDNRHFQHKFQMMPKNGYTEMFEKMLSHQNIKVILNTKSEDVFHLDSSTHSVIIAGKPYEGKIIYTGQVDRLLNYKYGKLPYRSLHFEVENYSIDSKQDVAVLNWPDKRAATRRTEMKKLTSQYIYGKTSTITEYPGEYNADSEQFQEPYYPIIKKENIDVYSKYKQEIDLYKNLFLVGRLAEYKYYNMEAAISAAMSLCTKVMR